MYRDEKRGEIEKFVASQVGRRLPGERDLAEKVGISRPRLRAILQELEAEGRVQRRRGSGTYALAAAAQDFGSATLLLDSALKLGDDPFISRLVEQVQHVLQNAGVSCFIHRTGSTALPSALPIADGIIAIGVAAHAALKIQASRGIPAVALLADVSSRPEEKLSLLGLEDEAAGRKAAEKLVESGIRSVLFFGRPALPAARERLKGIRRELEKARVPLEVVSCGMNYNAGFEQGCRLRVPARERRGIIAANDWLAMGLQAGLASQSRQGEKTIPLVSFDGLPLAQPMRHLIGSLAVPIETMAHDALDELRRLKKPGSKGRTIRYALTWV